MLYRTSWLSSYVHYFDTFSDTASGNDIEGTAHCMLHYFFDAVMPILQAFYTKFYIPEKDMYPAEVENTDKLARAFVVGTIREYVSIAFFSIYMLIFWASVTGKMSLWHLPKRFLQQIPDFHHLSWIFCFTKCKNIPQKFQTDYGNLDYMRGSLEICQCSQRNFPNYIHAH